MNTPEDEEDTEKLFERAKQLVNAEYRNKINNNISSRTRNKVNSTAPLSASNRAKATRTARRELQKEWANLKNASIISTADQPKQRSPSLAEILNGIVAYVEIDNNSMTSAIEKVLKTLGATVYNSFSNEVTHIIFKNGSFDTFKRAKLLNVCLVSVLWVEACKNSKKRVPEKLFPVVDHNDYAGSPRVFRRFMERNILYNEKFLSRAAKRLMLAEANGLEIGFLSDDDSSNDSHHSNIETHCSFKAEDISEVLDDTAERKNTSADADNGTNTTLNTSKTNENERSFINELDRISLNNISERVDESFGHRNLTDSFHSTETHQNNDLVAKKSKNTECRNTSADNETFSPNSSKTNNNERSVNSDLEGSSLQVITEHVDKSFEHRNLTDSFHSTEAHKNNESAAKDSKNSTNESNIVLRISSDNANDSSVNDRSVNRSNNKSHIRISDTLGSECETPSLNLADNCDYVTIRSKRVNYSDVTPILSDKNESLVKDNGGKKVRKLFNNKQDDTSWNESISQVENDVNPYVKEHEVTRRRPKRIIKPKTKKRINERVICEEEASQSSADEIADENVNTQNIDNATKKKRNVFKQKTREWDKDLRKRQKARAKEKRDLNNKTAVARCKPVFLKSQRSRECDILRNPSIVGTFMHRPENSWLKESLEKLGRFRLRANVGPDTTHVIAGAPVATVNILKGIARGCWIVNKDWVQDSLAAGRWLREHNYEMTQISPAVMKNRIERTAIGPEYTIEIFKNIGKIYIGPRTTPSQKDLQSLVKLCKGDIVPLPHEADIIIGDIIPGRTTYYGAWLVKSVREGRLKNRRRFIMASV